MFKVCTYFFLSFFKKKIEINKTHTNVCAYAQRMYVIIFSLFFKKKPEINKTQSVCVCAYVQSMNTILQKIINK